MISRSDHKIILRNYEGFISAYTEPVIEHEECEICKEMLKKGVKSIGIEALFTGEAQTLRPTDSVRERRKKSKFHA
jgi:lysine 2,3-aminomutase